MTNEQVNTELAVELEGWFGPLYCEDGGRPGKWRYIPTEELAERLTALRHPLDRDAVLEQAQWIATTDRLPEKPGVERYEHVWCLIVYKGVVLMRPWNCEHLCWDDADGDDWFCHPTEPTHWRPLPDPPALSSSPAKDAYSLGGGDG